jgi:hypothetical protein
MSKTTAILLTVLLTCTTLLAQKRDPLRESPSTRRARQVLFDFRITRAPDMRPVPPATQRSVLSRVFRRYLIDESKCSAEVSGNDSDPLRAARNAGQIVPAIIDMATGSFTAPLVTQTAYVIAVNECNASHADNFGTKRVAIFSGPQLVADIDVDFKSNIVRKTDLNGDGIDELLMTTGDMNQGVMIEIGALLEFQNRRVRVIEEFGTVMEDSCASGAAGSSVRASVVYFGEAATGKMPQFRVENFEASCRRTKRWRFLSNGKMAD